VASTSSTEQRTTVTGTIARQAHGSLRVSLSYRTAEGKARSVSGRARIRHGDFRHSLALPASASSVTLHVLFRGDKEHGIAGASVARRVSLG
jgi:hypothetical protein